MILLRDGKGRFGPIQEKSDTRCFVSSLIPLILFILTGCYQDAPTPSAERTVGVLRDLVQDESPEIRRTAAEALGKIGDPASITSILLLQDDPAPIVRAAEVQALGRVGSASNEVVAALARSLEDPVDAVRQAAAIAIGEIEPKADQLGPIVRLVGSTQDVHVKETAMRSLVQLDLGRWEGDLELMLRDSDAAVRQATVAVMGPSGGSTAARELGRLLVEDAAPSVRAEAAYQMGKRTDANVRAALERAAISDPDSNVRRWAEEELKSLRGND